MMWRVHDIAQRSQDAARQHPGRPGRADRRNRTRQQHQACGVVGAFALLVGEVGGDDHAVSGIVPQCHGYREVTNLADLGMLVAPLDRFRCRRDALGERPIARENL
ncbi:hypothetical protein [Mycolicibacterium sp. XJ1819]